MSSNREISTPLLPREDAREAALFFVVAALCFLAALSALSARATYGAATNWSTQVEGEMTIRLKGADRRGAEEARDVVLQTPGIAEARVLDRAETEALLEPWFGSAGLPESLPLPTMIAAKSETGTSIGPDVARRLISAGFEAEIDEHGDWADDVQRSLGALRLTALGAVGLLTLTAIAVIAFATHAALLARRDIVDVLHLSGAEDGFIANLFARRFWLLGLQAGAVGALFALGVTAFLIYTAQTVRGDGWLLPRLNLQALDLALLAGTPVLAAIAARWAARATVLTTLSDTV